VGNVSANGQGVKAARLRQAALRLTRWPL